MIFTTVGTHNDGFPRLIRAMDEFASESDDDVIIQYGYTNIVPSNAIAFKFLHDEYFELLYQTADTVVAHGGAGTIIDVLSHQKPLVIVPRLAEHDEHIDNQQTDLADVLSGRSGIEVVYDVSELKFAIERLRSADATTWETNDSLSTFLASYLQNL